MFVIMCSTDHQCIWHNMRFDLIWLSSFRLSKNYFSMNLLQMEWEKNGFELYKGVLYKINQDNSSTYRSNSYLVDIFVLDQFRVSGFFFLGFNELYLSIGMSFLKCLHTYSLLRNRIYSAQIFLYGPILICMSVLFWKSRMISSWLAFFALLLHHKVTFYIK